MSERLSFVGPSVVPKDHIAQGLRVKVYPFESPGEANDRVLRVPIDPDKDRDEEAGLYLFVRYFEGFLPDPRVLTTVVGGEIRTLVSCERFRSNLLNCEPSDIRFASHLDALPDLEQKLLLLRNLRLFVNKCKEFFEITRTLPDLVGKGNLILQDSRVILLDLNNVLFNAGDEFPEGEIEVPVDSKGYPVFDLSLRILYRIERRLLSYVGGNFSTMQFNKDYRAKRTYGGSELPQELKGLLKNRADLQKDPLYGAVRFGARREAVERIMERRNQGVIDKSK